MRQRQPCAPRTRGVVLLALMLALAIGGVAALAAMDVASLSRQRERELQLLFVGDQYRKAIQHYFAEAPAGASHVLPSRLQDLIEDDRFPMPVRHLRRLFPDPITGRDEWGLLQVGGRIAGVYSLSAQAPAKQAGFAPAYQHFSGRAAYREWVFAVAPLGAMASPSPPAASAPAAGTPESKPQWPERRSSP
jgi:type II secretory pathway pseudopilin PulG